MNLNNHRKILIIKLIDDANASGNWGKSDTKKLNSLKSGWLLAWRIGGIER
jgi:hypothetical protein